jgi:hypothetical protein
MNRNIVGALMLAAVCLSVRPAFAADDPPAGQSQDRSPSSEASSAQQVFVTAAVVQEHAPSIFVQRPATLPRLYATWIGLQAYDTYSTLVGVSRGAAETNPMVNGLTRNRAMFFATKASMTLVTVGVAEQMWRDHHPGRAIALMIVSNGVMAVVAARNASVLHGLP